MIINNNLDYRISTKMQIEQKKRTKSVEKMFQFSTRIQYYVYWNIVADILY